MAIYSTDQLRNLALISHSGAGKTTLAESLLFHAEVISRKGKVEDGNTTGDYEPEAIKRGGSTQLSILPLPWRDHKVTLIDTPGYFDFLGDAVSGLRVADAAILVVSATSDLEVGTELMWKRVRALGLPCVIFVNKLDRENTNFLETAAQLTSNLGQTCVPIQLQIGEAQDFAGVINLLDSSVDIPENLKGAAADARERLVEAIAESDDDLATKYLEGESLTDEELSHALRKAIMSCDLVPVLAGSALNDLGLAELLDLIVDYSPSGSGKSATARDNNGDESELDIKSDASLAALVFKTTADQYVGKLSFIRVYSGTLKSDSEVLNANKQQTERIGQLFVPRGKEQEQVSQLVAGEIGAVGRLSSTATGDTLSNTGKGLIMDGVDFPDPLYSMAVYPKAKADTDKLSTALNRLVEEDPSLKFARETDTGEALLIGLGDSHVELAVQRAQRKLGANLLLETPRVPYKETLGAVAKVDHRHKQQSGGHGHFAHVQLRLEPLDTLAGIQFATEVTGGNVPREFIPAVEKGVRRACAEGVLAGFPVVDIRAVLFDGSFHPVDSATMDFDIAGYYGLKKGFLDGSPTLMEPVMIIRVTTPDNYTGDIIGDINSKRGKILGMIPQSDGETIVEAHVPLSEVQRYALQLRSITQGRASFSMEFDHHEAVPANLAQKVIEGANQGKE
ncbi:MAG: elongation factor G [SAR202 cluster bacterium]|mgnify:CR=1 FL=1|nr:elongation factor G [SAR202 cluster bacterium]